MTADQRVLTYGSLFSGGGLLDLGLERAGLRCRWQVEYDPTRKEPWDQQPNQRLLAARFPEAKRYGDITKLRGEDLEPVDIIVGGFPCQPHSNAGKRRGADDERDLWDEMLRIICGVRPRWVLAENVPGLLTTDAGRFFGRVLRTLAESGFDAEWQSLTAAACGAPHRRERIFIVAVDRRQLADAACR